MLFRSKGKELAKAWDEMLERDSTIWDQNAFNDLFRSGANTYTAPGQKNRLFYGYGWGR